MKPHEYWSVTPLLVSCAIGTAVAGFFNLYLGELWPNALAHGALAGLFIGALAEASFILTARWINRKPLLSFAAVALVIAVGTAGFVRSFIDVDASVFAAIVGVSEVAGLSATFAFWRYSARMNRRLRETKRHFTPHK